MVHVVTRGLKQDATWWAVTPDGYGGDTFGPAIAVKVRWEDRKEVYYGQLDRRELISNAVVFVDRDVATGDWLYLGTTDAGDPSLFAGAFKVQRFDKIPDLRNLNPMRRAVL